MMVPDWAGYCEFRDRFEEVADVRYYPMGWLDQQILDGNFQFMRSANAAIIIERRQYPSGAEDVHGVIAAGDLREIVEVLIPRAEAWGREHGCIAALIESRPAWAKTLAPFGYQPHQLTIRKDL